MKNNNLRTYKSSQKYCCTCNNWVGLRELSKRQNYVMVDNSIAGKCFGYYKNSIKKSNETCFDWTKWNLLIENKIVDTILKLEFLLK